MALKFPLHNLRQRIDGQWQQQFTTETITVPTTATDGYYIVHLEEVPDNGQVNGRVVISGLSETTTYPPGTGEFFVNYATGRIAFHTDQQGQSLSAEYYKKGSLIEAEDINWLAQRIVDDFNSSYIISDTEPPSANAFVGQQWFDSTTGLTYVWDIREKWISNNREIFVFGRNGATRNQYLSYYAGSMTSNQSGLRLFRNACITGASVQLSSSLSCDIEIRKNGSVTPLHTFNISSKDNAVNNNLDIDILADDISSDKIQVYLSSTTPIQDPIVMIEIAWRN